MTIRDYIAAAAADYDQHAYDQWFVAWSAKKVAQAAAARGEISRGNVGFLARQIVAGYERQRAESNAMAQRQADAAWAVFAPSMPEDWTAGERAEAERLIRVAHVPIVAVAPHIAQLRRPVPPAVPAGESPDTWGYCHGTDFDGGEW